MNDVRILRNGTTERLIVSAPPEALPPIDIEPARSPYDHAGKAFSTPAPVREKPGSAALDVLRVLLLSVAGPVALALICWSLLRFGDSLRHFLGL